MNVISSGRAGFRDDGITRTRAKTVYNVPLQTSHPPLLCSTGHDRLTPLPAGTTHGLLLSQVLSFFIWAFALAKNANSILIGPTLTMYTWTANWPDMIHCPGDCEDSGCCVFNELQLSDQLFFTVYRFVRVYPAQTWGHFIIKSCLCWSSCLSVL